MGGYTQATGFTQDPSRFDYNRYMQQLQHKLGDYTILSNGGTLNRDRMGNFNNQMQGEVDMFGRQVGYRQPPFQ